MVEKLDKDLFDKLKSQLMMLDPVLFCEKYLTLDGKPFSLHNNGYKPFADIYRYIGIKALEPNSKPVILVKGRQVGGTTMACALEMYFMGSGLFGVGDRPAIRVIHAFPQLELAAAYSKTKLNPMISSSCASSEMDKKLSKPKSYMQNLLDVTSATNDSLHFKQFIGGNHLWIESTGLDADRIMGRQLCLETDLPTPNGFIKLKDLKEGDQLFDENGDICNVTKLHPIDLNPESYKITFDDGSIINACKDHLWLTYTKKDRIVLSNKDKPKPTIKTTKEILDTLKCFRQKNHSIPNCLPVKYSYKELPMDPYLLGLCLGSEDQIPQNYMYSSFEQRLSLVQGLLDADGYCDENGNIEYFQVREDLAKQFHELILSFGIKAKIYKEYKVKFTTELSVFRTKLQHAKINKSVIKSTHRFIQSIEEIIPVPMRCITVDSPSKLFLVTKSFIPTHNTADVLFFDECFPYHQLIITNNGNFFIGTLYNNFVQNKIMPLIKSFNTKTKTTEYKKILNVWKRQAKPLILLYINNEIIECTPNHKFLTESGWVEAKNLLNQKLITSTNKTVVVDKITQVLGEDDVYDIEVEDNHNFILPGNNIIAHNCQKTTGQAIGNALKILTTAKYGKPSKGVQVFFGTPRRKGSDFHKMWQSSSQQYFQLGCESCKNLFPLYTPGTDDWEKIWIHGYTVKCTHCGHEQDKRHAAERGKWVGLKDLNDDDCRMIGFHLNQLYMPTFTKEDLVNEKPGLHPINTERTYQNEVMGEFFQGDTSPITPEEIKENCGDIGRKFRARIVPGEETIVALGIDYGARADLEQMANPEKSKVSGQSYSTAVILTAKGPNLLSIEFCTKFKRNDPESKKGIIDQLMRQYNVDLAVGDIGFSNDFSQTLQNSYGAKYLVSRAHSKVNNNVKYLEDAFPKEIIFSRDFYIAELYDQMKKGQIRFPFGDYEKIGWLIEHCASMEVKPSISKTGDPTIHYVKGSTPNDGFMALLNAYIAYKFIITKGFTITNPLLMEQNQSKKKQILAVTGVISRRM